MSKLILTADDYGLNPGVNAAILQSVRNGTVTSVHVLVNYASETDIRLLAQTIHEHDNRCGIGLHFCTTAGPSVLQQPSSLTKLEGGRYRFYDITQWNAAATTLADMEAELAAQFDKLRNIIGAERIDSFSSHHNIHLFNEAYMQILVRLAENSWIPLRSPLRWTQEKGFPNYPDGFVFAPVEQDAIRTLFQCRQESTKKLLFDALDKDRMKKNRDLANDNKKTGGTPNTTSGHWYGQPSKRALNWTLQQLDELFSTNTNKYYATEIFMHLSDSVENEDPLHTYPMSKRLVEYTTLNNAGIKNLINTLYSKPDFELGSYRKVLLGEEIHYNL